MKFDYKRAVSAATADPSPAVDPQDIIPQIAFTDRIETNNSQPTGMEGIVASTGGAVTVGTVEVWCLDDDAIPATVPDNETLTRWPEEGDRPAADQWTLIGTFSGLTPDPVRWVGWVGGVTYVRVLGASGDGTLKLRRLGR